MDCVMSASWRYSQQNGEGAAEQEDLYLETLGISEEERRGIVGLIEQGGTNIDPVVNYLVGASNGLMYRELIGKLESYPIPELPLADARGELFLDVGCNWGRWCVAAARKGYRPVGLDPSLGAVMAARRVAEQLGLDANFVVGDARWLPFCDQTFDQIFSYSVIQHFSYGDAEKAIGDIGRVIRSTGQVLVQLPNVYGIRCLYHQARRRFRRPAGFDVRYWTPNRMVRTFNRSIGRARLSADCFFGIGLQVADIDMMPTSKKLVIKFSETLKRLAARVPFATLVADSLWVETGRRIDPRRESPATGLGV